MEGPAIIRYPHPARALLLFVDSIGLVIPAVALGQSFDLAGFCQDDNGTPYRLRQVGSELYWYMDGVPAW